MLIMVSKSVIGITIKKEINIFALICKLFLFHTPDDVIKTNTLIQFFNKYKLVELIFYNDK